MIFVAGLALLFLGLALVVPGPIPVRRDIVISATAARWAGGVLLAFLPSAILMHYLWQRTEWGRSVPLLNAQWSAFGLLGTICLGILGWSVFGPKKRIVKPKEIKPEMFEEVRDEPPPVAGPRQPVLPQSRPLPLSRPETPPKPAGGAAPFDFS